MTVTTPDLLINAATQTWGHVSDGFVEINSTDDSLDGQSITFRLEVESNINPLDNIFLTSDFIIHYEVIPCTPNLTAT